MWALAVVAGTAAVVLLRWRRSGQSAAEFFGLLTARFYSALWHRCSTNGRAPLPAKGPALLVSNHTCSADPPLLLSASPRLFGFLTAREHYGAHPFFRWVLDQMRSVPVTRNGCDGVAARRALDRLREGHILCVFPEAGLSGVARNRLRSAKHGAAYLALKCGAPVYPAYIAGGPRTEDLLRAWLRPSRPRARVYYGPAIDLSAYRDRPIDRRLLQEVTEQIMRRVEALRPER
jgi:1-acyl-sn-glycerol-3-phosphate acyltransferase